MSERFNRALQNSWSDNNSTRESSVVFLGSPIRFSQRLLDTFQSEFNWFEFKLVSNLSELSQLTSQDHNVAMVVVEETFIDRLISSTDAFFNAAGQTRVIFAYYDARQAIKLISERKSSPQLKDVGFLPLGVQMDVWLSVMNLLLCGEVFYPSELVDNLPILADNTITPCEETASLTSREWEVLDLVALGMQNKNIAIDLGLSQHTIKLHIHNILKKIGVSNRTCAARWYASSAIGDQRKQPDSAAEQHDPKQ